MAWNGATGWGLIPGEGFTLQPLVMYCKDLMIIADTEGVAICDDEGWCEQISLPFVTQEFAWAWMRGLPRDAQRIKEMFIAAADEEARVDV